MTSGTNPALHNRVIVDTHVHFLNKERLTYPWMDSVPLELNQTLEPNEYWQEVRAGGSLSSNKSHKCMVVEADCTYSSKSPLAEVDYFESLNHNGAKNKNENAPAQLVGGIVAYASMEEGPEMVEPLLKALSERKIVKGVRRILQSETDKPEFMLPPNFVDSIKLLAKYNLTFDLCIVQEQLPQVIQLVDACPDVSFVLDHMGKPAIKDSPTGALDEDWAKNISKLATFSNVVAVKVSGLLTEANLDTWTRQDIEPYIRHVVTEFGTDQCMFGSDWPILRLAGDYNRWVSVLLDILLDTNSDYESLLKTDEDIDKFFSGNAQRVYRLY